VLLKKTSILAIQQSLETVSPLVPETLICQEKTAKEEFGHSLHYQYLFWKKKARMLWFKDGEKNTAIFLAMVKRRNHFSVIHRLRTRNGVIEDPKLIEDHILNFFRILC